MFIYLDILSAIIFQFPSTYCLSVFCLSCLLVFWNEENGPAFGDGQLLCYLLSQICVLKKEYGNTHLVTGDLLTLSGSSVTLKKKTKMVHVRNQLTNRAAIITVYSALHKQPITDVHRYTDITFNQSTNTTTENWNWRQWWIL